MVQNAPVSAPSPTPFTDFVLARIPDEETQKLFALSFGEHLRRDPDALEIDFDDVYRWLGIDRKDSALRLLKREFSSDEYVFHSDVELNSGGRPRDVYKISFNQFEELMISAQTARARRLASLCSCSRRSCRTTSLQSKSSVKPAGRHLTCRGCKCQRTAASAGWPAGTATAPVLLQALWQPLQVWHRPGRRQAHPAAQNHLPLRAPGLLCSDHMQGHGEAL